MTGKKTWTYLQYDILYFSSTLNLSQSLIHSASLKLISEWEYFISDHGCVISHHCSVFGSLYTWLFCCTWMLQILITGSSNLILRHWDWTSGVVMRSWKVLLMLT